MAFINHLDLEKVITAIEEKPPYMGEPLFDALELLKKARDEVATPEEIEEAKGKFQKGWGPFSDEIEIDDAPMVGVSRADEGIWVNAWVWLARPADEEDDDDAEEQP